jgi:hypothetical protein
MVATGFSSRFLHRVRSSGVDPAPDAQRQARKERARFEADLVVHILTADPAALLEVPLNFIVYPGSSSNRPTIHRHVT